MGCNCLIHFAFSCLFFIVAAVLAPIRFIFQFFYYYHPDLFRPANNPETHRQKVLKIQEQIKEWNANGRRGLLCSSRPIWKQFTLRNFNKREMNQIEMDLEDIVEIDMENQILTVEPRMKMGTLSSKLLPLGWTIPVVPEFEELTVGGLICGGGIESSSSKWGCFYKTCVSLEVVVSSGECIICSENENSDLFESIPMSYGTLGFVTAVKMKLIRATPFIELKYFGVEFFDKAKELLENTEADFVEGLQYGPNQFVIMHGNFVDQAPSGKIQRFSRWYSPLFHWDTKKYLNKPPGETQYIPTRDYYHRHQRGYFWTYTSFAPYLKYSMPRFLFGWILPFNYQLVKYYESILCCSTSTTLTEKVFSYLNFFLQDYLVPIDKLEVFLNRIDKEIQVYPLWLCPIRGFPTEGLIQPINNEETLYVDIGIYGMSPKPFTREERLKLWKRFEIYTLECIGCIGFYTDSYLTREEFIQMFNHKLYLKTRSKYKANGAFPILYDKVSVETRNPKLYAEFKNLIVSPESISINTYR